MIQIVDISNLHDNELFFNVYSTNTKYVNISLYSMLTTTCLGSNSKYNNNLLKARSAATAETARGNFENKYIILHKKINFLVKV